MRLAWRMALQYAAILVLVAVLLFLGAPAVAEHAMVDALGPVLLRQARGVAALLDVQPRPGWPYPAYLADLAAVRLSRLYVDGEVLVVDGQGLIRWNSATLVGDLRGWRLAPEVIRGIGAPGYGVREILEDVPAVVAVAPIPQPGGGVLGAAVVFRPLRELGGVRRQIITWLVLGTGVAVAAALAAGWAVGYGLVRRLAAIRRAAGELAEGHLSRRIAVRGRDEVAELAADFNHMADRIEALVEELRRSQQLRRAMLATISHELRTPVAVIRGLGEALRDGLVAGGREAGPHARQIVEEAERLGRLIDDLFQLARLEMGQLDIRLQRLNAGRWLEEAGPALATLAREHGARWEVAVDPALAQVWLDADPDRLAQVLGNLVGNAARHAGSGGRVRLAAAAVPGGVRVEVADDGPGIEPGDLPHLFEPFYRGSSSARSRGAGLGLSIVRALVEAHGGRVGVESSPGAGATFWFTLPAAVSPATGSAGPRSRAAVLPPGGRRAGVRPDRGHEGGAGAGGSG